MNVKQMTNEELNQAAALAEYKYDAHYRACPYCRNSRAQGRPSCTTSKLLYAALVELEFEQERRAEEAAWESDQRAERRNEQVLSGVE